MSPPPLRADRAIVLALGSNIGPGRALLDRACRLLHAHGVTTLRRSRIYRTRPWGVTDQPNFTNAAIAVSTTAPPRALLAICLSVERAMGRRRFRPWGPRLIDIDLLWYRDAAMNIVAPYRSLTLPHPGITQRDFVLAPLLDLHLSNDAQWRQALAALAPEDRSLLGSEKWR